MIAMIISWFDQRETQRAKERHRLGFEWAMGTYYLEGKSLYEIEASVGPCGSQTAMDTEPFDEGVMEALQLLNKMEFVRVEVQQVTAELEGIHNLQI